METNIVKTQNAKTFSTRNITTNTFLKTYFYELRRLEINDARRRQRAC